MCAAAALCVAMCPTIGVATATRLVMIAKVMNMFVIPVFVREREREREREVIVVS